ncbi:unnamed protein product [Microthlaspi erraticum]|uniref:Uncharacterized protein n=1 Tax=Microthlaspi erraticum TaxID=1685480 RepID=A0A6D2HXE1_9BRAS|nr:unnamed protein product [Microthlaspi erraticum]
MIMGGLLDGRPRQLTISAIKEYERKAVAAHHHPYIHKRIPTISFTDKDAGGLDTPHLDPLVVTDVKSGFTKLLDLCKCTDRGSMGIEHKDWLLSTL